MASYLIMTPPGAPADDERARFIADGFSWTAFFFPGPWLIVKRAWLIGISVAILQFVLLLSASMPGGFGAALLVHLALGLIVSLEGPLLIASKLSARDWTLRSVVPARDLETAEEIYYSSPGSTDHETHAAPLPSIDRSSPGRPAGTAGLGFFESYGER
ncbi:DUF2628 domain-containing protein [Mesorhizobium plurifarium]|uniref:DUF2628 domain-containing protein n=1 Tax=Sinorhizobium arboris TaxID=76745 RepID=UPI00040C861D|nr:DUF2628 domain-containing protein [Sinorhizobium arboris]PST17556.1 DUF2628 domain-containing protein [Mesorhizobium plurifarium]